MISQRLWKYRGLMVIVLWQAAPPVTRTESGGRTQFGLGYGQSRIDDLYFTGGGCEADATPAVEHFASRRSRSFGASVTGWTAKHIRVGAAVTVTSADTSSLSGTAVKGVAAGEWKWFGIGIGALTGTTKTPLLPGVYLRAGPLTSLHLRADMPDLSMPVSSSGVGRAGVAYNQTNDGLGVFLGVPICYTTCEYDQGGVRADIRMPVGRNFDVAISGFTHSIDDQARDQRFWGVAVAGHIQR